MIAVDEASVIGVLWILRLGPGAGGGYVRRNCKSCLERLCQLDRYISVYDRTCFAWECVNLSSIDFHGSLPC